MKYISILRGYISGTNNGQTNIFFGSKEYNTGMFDDTNARSNQTPGFEE
jgi:hypothetical protein